MPSRILRTIDVNGRPRTFLIERPDAHGPLPTVIMLHGTGGTAVWAADETAWGATARRHGFAVVYPEGLPPDPAKPPKFLTNPPIWHDGSFGPGDEEHQSADAAFISTMLNELIVEREVDPARVYVTGFSNGAGMTFALAAAMPDRLRAIAPVAGHCWIDPPRRAMPTLYIVGDSDPLIPLEGGWVKTPWGRQRYKPAVRDTLEKWTGTVPGSRRQEGQLTIDAWQGGVQMHSIIVAGLGHHWPGGQGKLNHRIAGPACDALDANETIWKFFRD